MIRALWACVLLLLMCRFARNSSDANANLTALSDCTIDDLRRINGSFGGDDAVGASPAHSSEFFFDNCDMPTIPDAFFANVSHVKSVHFHSCNIDAFSAKAFDGLHELEAFSVTGNSNITRLQLWSSQSLDTVIKIVLSANNIDRFDVLALSAYPNLTELNLSDNLLTRIPIGAFDASLNLAILNLENNRINRLDSGTFKTLLRLSDLNLASNRIKYLDSFTFTAMAHLTTLRLNRNAILSLPALIFFNLDRLETLYLSGNLLQTIDDRTFQQNKHLLYLDLSYNRLERISSETLMGLENLQVLSLSHNEINTILAAAFQDLRNLQTLDISSNKLVRVTDNRFAYFAKIVSIDMAHNNISYVHQFTFTDLQSLQHLDLSYNRLASDSFVSLQTHLKHLNLAHNLYKTFNISTLRSIERVNLTSNPWNCTWLLSEFVQQNHRITEMHFGRSVIGVETHNAAKQNAEDVVCFDYHDDERQNAASRSIFLIDSHAPYGNGVDKDLKKSEFNAYPRFSKLLSNEFDYKACLLWIIIAVSLVVGLVRLGKYCFERSERRSERYRITQQEKVMKEIDDYFAKQKSNRR